MRWRGDTTGGRGSSMQCSIYLLAVSKTVLQRMQMPDRWTPAGRFFFPVTFSVESGDVVACLLLQPSDWHLFLF